VKNAAFLLTLLAMGCATPKVAEWRLEGSGRTLRLVPPGAKPGATAMELQRARAKKAGKGCNLAGPPVKLAWKGRTAQIALSDASVLSGGMVTLEGGPARVQGEILADLGWFDQFKSDLGQMERRGCLRSGEANPLAQRVIENLSVPSGMGYRLRYGDYARTGWIDLEPQFRLRTVTPVRVNGAIEGYEEAWYDLLPRPGGGLAVQLALVEVNRKGTITKSEHPAVELLSLPESGRYLRMYFRSWTVAGDRKIALLAGPSVEERARGGAEFEKDPEGFCSRPGSITCVAVPREMVLSAELRVATNHGTVAVPVGGSVGDALRVAGVRDYAAAVKTLEMWRPFEGKPLPVRFDRSQNAILGIALMGGEELRW